jgi:hypothetical protein
MITLRSLRTIHALRDTDSPHDAAACAGTQPLKTLMLAGLRESIGDDDQLTTVAEGIFDGLLTAFASEEAQNG